MSWFKPKDLLDRSFEIGIILKGLDGVAETIGGLLLLFVTPSQINSLVTQVTQHELTKDPHDYIATHLLHYSQGLTSGTVMYAAIYLLAHGVVKVVLVGALLGNKLWAYPWLIAVLVAFIGYQTYQLALKFSIGLFLLTLFDIAIVLLTWREWRKQRAHHAEEATASATPDPAERTA
ncbi:MAG TPA: DUF2127 domain-containing protein [Micromonosporaceae bacterium]|nr:DUF2127 domain-containing protein [Micromonosporaceae bacterium]